MLRPQRGWKDELVPNVWRKVRPPRGLPDHGEVPSDPKAQARFWVARNVARWRQVIERERRDSLVVVDTDPFKLHYVWTLWRTGQVLQQEWDLQREASREGRGAHDQRRARVQCGLVRTRRLYLVSDVDEATLRPRREADTTRTHGGFERHVLLCDSLLRWYRAIDNLEPGRVRFELPETGLTPDLLALGPRQVRSGADLFDRLLTCLN